MSRISKSSVRVLLCVVVAVSVAGCASRADSGARDGANSQSMPSQAGPSDGRQTLSPPESWDNRKAEIIESKQEDAAADPTDPPANAGAYAYQTNSVLVDADGDYTLTAGPIAPEDEAAIKKTMVLQLPTNVSFKWSVREWHFTTDTDEVYLVADVTVNMLHEPYADLSAWIA